MTHKTKDKSRSGRYSKILQQTSRHYSRWMPAGPMGYISCCDCGLVHKEQYRVLPASKGRVRIIWRTKRAVGETAKRRKTKRYKCQPAE